MTAQAKITTARAARREMSIEQALRWAFGTEHARVEFNEMGETSGAARMGVWAASVDGDDGLAVAYDVPQENGNREDLRWLQASNGALTLDVRRVGGQDLEGLRPRVAVLGGGRRLGVDAGTARLLVT